MEKLLSVAAISEKWEEMVFTTRFLKKISTRRRISSTGSNYYFLVKISLPLERIARSAFRKK